MKKRSIISSIVLGAAFSSQVFAADWNDVLQKHKNSAVNRGGQVSSRVAICQTGTNGAPRIYDFASDNHLPPRSSIKLNLARGTCDDHKTGVRYALR